MAGGKRRAKESRQFVDTVDDELVVAAIRNAELHTTGQIRVHISSRASKDVERAARKSFEKLNMAATRDRNAVLIFLQPRTHTFFLVGDTAFDEHGGSAFWEKMAEALSADLAEGLYTEGLVQAVQRAGELLATHFPRRPDEPPSPGLPDEVAED